MIESYEEQLRRQVQHWRDDADFLISELRQYRSFGSFESEYRQAKAVAGAPYDVANRTLTGRDKHTVEAINRAIDLDPEVSARRERYHAGRQDIAILLAVLKTRQAQLYAGGRELAGYDAEDKHARTYPDDTPATNNNETEMEAF